MEQAQFAQAQRSRVRWAEGGYWAFLPEKLPPGLELAPGLVARLSEADRAVGEVSGLGRTLPDPHLLARSLLRREAVLSSRIEGTQASLSDLVLFEIESSAAPQTADVREVANYVRAADHLLDPDRRLPISLPLLREAHAILLADVRGGHAAPGEFRRSPNWIGPTGATIATATYVPPSPENLWSCLDSFEKYLHADDPLPPLLRIGMLHYQFESIHPFLDGNGRIGRLLIVVLMIEWGLLPAPLLDLSAFIEASRTDYYDALLRVSTHGDWLGWLDFFLHAVTTQARATLRRAEALTSLRADYRARVVSPRASALLPELVDELFASPALTIGRAATKLQVTPRAARLNVERLVVAGILAQVGVSGRTRLFVAPEILRILGEEPDSSERTE